MLLLADAGYPGGQGFPQVTYLSGGAPFDAAFIRQVKEQVGVSGLIGNYGGITSALGKAIVTDIRGTSEVLRLIKLAAFSLSRPIRQVKFQADPNVGLGGLSFAVATPDQIRATVNDFLYVNQHPQLPSPAAHPAVDAVLGPPEPTTRATALVRRSLNRRRAASRSACRPPAGRTSHERR